MLSRDGWENCAGTCGLSVEIEQVTRWSMESYGRPDISGRETETVREMLEISNSADFANLNKEGWPPDVCARLHGRPAVSSPPVVPRLARFARKGRKNVLRRAPIGGHGRLGFVLISACTLYSCPLLDVTAVTGHWGFHVGSQEAVDSRI